MFAGVGIIGALASILASVLVGPTGEAQPADNATDDSAVHRELVAIRSELAALRADREAAAEA